MGGMEVCAQWVTGKPSPCLRPFVAGYVGYRLTGFAPGLHRGLPSRYLTFIVSIGPAIDVMVQADSSRAPSSYHCVVSGLQASAALISHDGDQEGVAIELSPLGSRALLGMPARSLWSTSVEFSDVVGIAGRELWERLQGVARWADRFAACDDVLTRLAESDRGVVPELRQAWHALVGSGGSAPIATVADTVGWSRQHLARRFADEFGLSPKLAARIVRLERARRMLQGSPSFVTIAQVAAVCGYYDQAHLNRDFVELAGCTPTALLADDLPSFQDEAAAGV